MEFDSIVFCEQPEDISFSRTSDGGDTWGFFDTPTPESTNGSGSISEDVSGDGTINVSKILAVINMWGSCDGCSEDINQDGFVNVADLLTIIAVW